MTTINNYLLIFISTDWLFIVYVILIFFFYLSSVYAKNFTYRCFCFCFLIIFCTLITNLAYMLQPDYIFVCFLLAFFSLPTSLSIVNFFEMGGTYSSSTSNDESFNIGATDNKATPRELFHDKIKEEGDSPGKQAEKNLTTLINTEKSFKSSIETKSPDNSPCSTQAKLTKECFGLKDEGAKALYDGVNDPKNFIPNNASQFVDSSQEDIHKQHQQIEEGCRKGINDKFNK